MWIWTVGPQTGIGNSRHSLTVFLCFCEEAKKLECDSFLIDFLLRASKTWIPLEECWRRLKLISTLVISTWWRFHRYLRVFIFIIQLNLPQTPGMYPAFTKIGRCPVNLKRSDLHWIWILHIIWACYKKKPQLLRSAYFGVHDPKNGQVLEMWNKIQKYFFLP